MRAAMRLLAAVLVSAPGLARADKFAGAFLDGGAGARALGMGNAFTGVADDASALYWNPAGLASATHFEAALAQERRFDLVDYTFGGAVIHVPQNDARVGFGVIRLAVDDIAFPDSSLWNDLDRDGTIDPGEFHYDEVLDRDKIRFESDQELGFFLSAAVPRRGLQWGGSLKVIYQSVGEFSSFGFGVDVGILKRDLVRNLDFGLAVHDLTGTYLSWSTGRKETIAPVPRLGLAYRWPSEGLRGTLLFAGDVDLHFDDRRTADQLWSGAVSANLHGGVEFTMQNRLALRVGIDESSFQAGAGLAMGPVNLDYGISPDAHDFDVSHRIAVRYVHAR